MYKVTINGKNYDFSINMGLLQFLREELDITSAKNGCGEGACGACMVLVDGKAVRACLFKLDKLAGKTVQTYEGLPADHKKVLVEAFANCGAVQCGFCIPGMIVSASALLNHNLQPSESDIKKAINGNVCRCTGYVKIIEAIMHAASALREDVKIDKKSIENGVGSKKVRIDAIAKANGTAEFVDDIRRKDGGIDGITVESILFGAVLRSPTARGLVKGLDISEAEVSAGVMAVITADSIPGKRFQGHIIHDWPALVAVGEETRCIGDAIALVAASTREHAVQAIEKIKLDYEPLAPIVDVYSAMQDSAIKIHEKGNVLNHTVVKRGDCDEAFTTAMHIVEHEFYTPPTEHACMEPESALALYLPNGKMRVYTGTQSVYDDLEGIVGVLGVDESEVEVVSKYVGGGFGGKEDLVAQHHAALLAYKCKRPVKVTLGRQESINVHPKRHAMHMKYKVGCDKDGILLAIKVEILADTGAYASLGGPVLQRACTHAGGPYKIANVDIDGKAIYTNNPPAGAFRGFGVTQSCFAMETCLNLLAEKIGISTWEIRWRNAIEPGDVMSNGQLAGRDVAFKQTLLAVKEVCEKNPQHGIACAMKNSGIGVGLPDIGRVRLDVTANKVVINTSAACMGQGIGTALSQIVAETANVCDEDILIAMPNTAITPDGGTSTASRQTVFNGEATRLAAKLLAKDLKNGKTLKDLEGKEYYHEYSGLTDTMNCGKENPISHISYGFATQVVLLDGDGRIGRVVAAHDVGKAINPQIVEGQIEGGVVMGLGYALTEDFPLKDGVPQVKYGTLGLWRAMSIPKIESIIIEDNPEELAYGAKGVGEIVTIPTAPAVAGAYWKYDGELRTKLPLANTPYIRKLLK